MRSIKQLLVALVVTTLAACGGGGTLDNDGGGTGGGTGGTTPTYTLSIENSDGESFAELSQAAPQDLTVTLTVSGSGSVAGQVITFELSDTELASLTPATTALTNNDGVATVRLLAGAKAGAGTLAASFGDASASFGFNSVGDGGAQVDVTVGSVSLFADTVVLGTGSSSKVELTALVRDANNIVLADVPVTFRTDSGELAGVDAATDENGVAKATLTSQTDKNIREITVTAQVQGLSSALLITASGTTLDITAPGSVVLGDTATIDVLLADSNDAGIASQVVEVTSALGNTLNPASPVTAASGKATFTYTATNPGEDTLSVSALGATNSVVINVSPDQFAFLAAADEADVIEVPLNSAEELEVEWLVDGTGNAGETVTFNTTRGVIAASAAAAATATDQTATDTTDAAGLAQTFVRSQFAGLATITATGGANSVSAKKVIEFVATVPAKIETQAFPAQLGIGETSTVRAVVRDANNNPVKNATVVFSLDNAAGGSLSSGTAVTNSQGVASTLFTADSTTGSGVDGNNLLVKASVQDDPAVFDETDIAVGNRTLFFRFGTGNVITKPSDSTYAKEFSIIVTDSSGNAVPGQQLNVAISSINYRKGYWVKSPEEPAAFKNWTTSGTTPAISSSINCVSEDANFNGLRDPGEDINGDGMLTPGNIAVVSGLEPSDANGVVTFDVVYPQDAGSWLDVRIQVSGVAAGTENVSYREYSLPTAADDLTTETNRPTANPFGVAQDCSVAD